MKFADNVVVWFEIPVSDMTRAVAFYETVFATKLKQETCQSTDFPMAVFDAPDQAVHGALIAYDGFSPSDQGSLVYLNAGEDLSLPLSRVEQAGGKVTVQKTLISPEIGYMALFIDSEGNRVGLHSLK
ncbi:VOC family protein [Telmatospirillum sp. J64-1]|uniref:VOC family protein n=1 Tax=Telmatospirillum sp. J64-1 TaxID=2502183 RepID=UPI00115D2DF7|nr:VOC family protein [Telmatospirillum sp. J64-1]